MADPEQFNADQLAFWNGPGGHTWVARQEHTDITFAAVTEALLDLRRAARRRAGAGHRLRLRRDHAGVCARRRPRRPRGGAGHLRADAGRGTGARRGRRHRQCRLAAGRRRHGGAGRIRFAGVGLRRDVLRRPGGGLRPHAPRRRPSRADGVRVLAVSCRKPVDGGADERGLSPPAPAAESGPATPPECSPSPIRSASPRFSPQPAGRRRGLTSSTSIWTSPPAAGWRRPWFSRPKSAPLTAGCAASRRMSLRPPSRPSARRWRRIWTARACACAVRYGWSAARPPERAARFGRRFT